MVKFAELKGTELGSAETCNKRTIYKAIHLEGIRSCQLVMGFTLLAPGSNWNTMPAHTHMRRSEVYFYFDVEPDQRVMHLMGPPDATSHIVMADKQWWCRRDGRSTRAWAPRATDSAGAWAERTRTTRTWTRWRSRT
jgi:5-keto 4-deoxyuronate isomerase